MNETQFDTGVAEVSGLALGGRRLVFLDRARIYACGITPYDVTHLGTRPRSSGSTCSPGPAPIGVEPEMCRNVTE